MARMMSTLLARVRQVLQDQDPDGYRYPTSDLAGYANDFVLEAKRLRPDLFVRKYVADLPQVSEEADVDYSAVAFPLPDNLFTAAVDYVAGKAELRDDEYAVDNRAMTLIGSATAKLTGSA